MNNTILEYIATERARGVRDEDIRGALLASGWKEEDVRVALGGGGISSASFAPETPRVAPGFSGAYLKQIFSGRIGRWHYFFGNALIFLVSVAVFILAGIAAVIFVGGLDSFWAFIQAMFLFMAIAAVVLTPFAVLGFSMNIRRLHDLGQSGWWILVSFLPLLSLVLTIYLLFFKGGQVPNRFGPVSNYARSRKGVWDALLGK